MSYPNPAQPSLLARALVPLGVIILGAVAAAIYVFYLKSAAPKTLESQLAPPTSPPAAANSGLAIPPLTAANSPATTSSSLEESIPADVHQPKVQGHKTNEDVLADVATLNVQGLTELLVREEFTRKLAIAIYGLSEGRVANQNRPLVSPEGAFAVNKIGEEPNAEYKMAAHNAVRYDLYVAALGALDSPAAVAVYARAYPLLQVGFEELGMGRRSFHQVVILAIDNLLAAPDSAEDAILIRPKMKYVFKDAQLEKLPATHKFMLRLGPQHNQTVKQHLRGLRQKLIDVNL